MPQRRRRSRRPASAFSAFAPACGRTGGDPDGWFPIRLESRPTTSSPTTSIRWWGDLSQHWEPNGGVGPQGCGRRVAPAAYMLRDAPLIATRR
jgi:hypothetical protein